MSMENARRALHTLLPYKDEEIKTKRGHPGKMPDTRRGIKKWKEAQKAYHSRGHSIQTRPQPDAVHEGMSIS